MIINKKVINALKPCKDRFDNFVSHHGDSDLDALDFLNLDTITYADKVWVMTRLLNRNQLVNWSIMCAESVKMHFDKKYPNNKVLDELFDYLKSGLNFEALTVKQISRIKELRSAAYADAYVREEQRNLTLLYLASVLE